MLEEGVIVELLKVNILCVICYNRSEISEGDRAVSSYSVVAGSCTSRSEDCVQTMKNISYADFTWYFRLDIQSIEVCRKSCEFTFS